MSANRLTDAEIAFFELEDEWRRLRAIIRDTEPSLYRFNDNRLRDEPLGI
jgi:hypothetical protein